MGNETISTLSSEETDILEPGDVDNDSESEDWQLEQERSDLESGLPPSGMGSESETFKNTEMTSRAREKGAWDEFDSEFFEADQKESTCWSEAEFSDWTAPMPLPAQLHLDWLAYTGEGEHHSESEPESEEHHEEGSEEEK